MITDKLRKKEDFTEVEMSLASFILNYGEQISYLSIRELADLTYTSTATIQRLCRKLGCSGFRDFKIRFTKEVTQGNEMSSGIDVNHPFHFGAQASVIARNLCKVYEQAVGSVMKEMDYDAVNRAADLIQKADIVQVYGIGDSGITARAFLNRLMKLNKAGIFASDFNEETAYAMTAQKKTVALFVSYRGGSGNQVIAARILNSRNIPYIVLSSDSSTYITETAEVRLTIPSYEVQSDNIATFFSQECFSFYLNLLYSIVYARSYLENRERKKEIDSVTSGRSLLFHPLKEE